MARKLSRLEIFQEQQVLLSKERTILSFMQTGLAFIGVGLIISNIFRSSISEFVGYILLLIGFLEVLESVRRLRRKQMEMDELKNRLLKA